MDFVTKWKRAAFARSCHTYLQALVLQLHDACCADVSTNQFKRDFLAASYQVLSGM